MENIQEKTGDTKCEEQVWGWTGSLSSDCLLDNQPKGYLLFFLQHLFSCMDVKKTNFKKIHICDWYSLRESHVGLKMIYYLRLPKKGFGLDEFLKIITKNVREQDTYYIVPAIMQKCNKI